MESHGQLMYLSFFPFFPFSVELSNGLVIALIILFLFFQVISLPLGADRKPITFRHGTDNPAYFFLFFGDDGKVGSGLCNPAFRLPVFPIHRFIESRFWLLANPDPYDLTAKKYNNLDKIFIFTQIFFYDHHGLQAVEKASALSFK
jgi:hypothetical protein